MKVTRLEQCAGQDFPPRTQAGVIHRRAARGVRGKRGAPTANYFIRGARLSGLPGRPQWTRGFTVIPRGIFSRGSSPIILFASSQHASDFTRHNATSLVPVSWNSRR